MGSSAAISDKLLENLHKQRGGGEEKLHKNNYVIVRGKASITAESNLTLHRT